MHSFKIPPSRWALKAFLLATLLLRLSGAQAVQLSIPADEKGGLSGAESAAANDGPRQSPFKSGASVVEDAQLKDLRGGSAALTSIEMETQFDVKGKVLGNTAIDLTTGQNTIDHGSFANMSGISSVIQNTGNNVLIQSSTSVQVQFN